MRLQRAGSYVFQSGANAYSLSCVDPITRILTLSGTEAVDTDFTATLAT